MSVHCLAHKTSVHTVTWNPSWQESCGFTALDTLVGHLDPEDHELAAVSAQFRCDVVRCVLLLLPGPADGRPQGLQEDKGAVLPEL